MDLFWHRRDLRPGDNRGLDVAGGDEPVLPVFVCDPTILEYGAPPRVAFLLEAVHALRDWYRDHGGDLLVAVGDPATELRRIVEAYSIDRVVWNRDYSGLATERDARVRTELDRTGIDWDTVHDTLLFPPGTITTQADTPYKVFKPFWEKWSTRDPPQPHPEPRNQPFASPPHTDIPSLESLGVQPPDATIPESGWETAQLRLTNFCTDPIYDYATARDTPASDGTSHLSPHLKFGTIGIRDVYQAVATARRDAPTEGGATSCTEFLRQLAWRDFYTHRLDVEPSLVSENHRTYEHGIDWRNDPDELLAWQRGETGYPIVDAGMRQLQAEAYMHNRVRMIVASFLTKDLRIDWRYGYEWFRDHLVDHDPANDAGGWQWAASTGPDAQPYFRIFNPMTQGRRHDPDADYIQEYVPELRAVPPETIHTWDELDPDTRAAAAPNYPAPIVDHATRREAAITMYETANGTE